MLQHSFVKLQPLGGTSAGEIGKRGILTALKRSLLTALRWWN